MPPERATRDSTRHAAQHSRVTPSKIYGFESFSIMPPAEPSAITFAGHANGSAG